MAGRARVGLLTHVTTPDATRARPQRLPLHSRATCACVRSAHLALHSAALAELTQAILAVDVCLSWHCVRQRVRAGTHPIR